MRRVVKSFQIGKCVILSRCSCRILLVVDQLIFENLYSQLVDTILRKICGAGGVRIILG